MGSKQLLQIRNAVAALLLLTAVIPARADYLNSLSQVTTGYYRIYSLAYNTTMAMSETSTGSDNVFCDTPNSNDYMQVWKIEVAATDESSKTVRLQNAVSERWINRSSGNFHTWPSAMTFTMTLTSDGFIIANGGGLHHQQSGHNVVSYGTDGFASKWQIEPATMNETLLAEQRADYQNYVNVVNNKATITAKLATYFTDASCSELGADYKTYTDSLLELRMTEDGIPQSAIAMALKVKNDSWEVYKEGWRYNERTFRIGTYKPVSKESVWRKLVNVGYNLSPNSDPTGIYVESGNIITAYVSTVPANGTIVLRNVPRQSATGDGYTLTAGFNILKIQSSGMLFVDYEVDNTTGGAAPFTLLSSYPDVKIHIEGGKVNGAFSALRGDTNDDWVTMKEYMFKHYDYIQLRSRKKIFNMVDSLVFKACPENMVGVLGLWDKVVGMEHNIMGLDSEFGGYFNTPMMAVSFTGDGHMYASSFGTYYNENTIADVMRYENLFAGGSLWGPAHEIGHINQAAINLIGQSEVSNNLFSNIAVYENGHLTSRAEHISTTLREMAEGVYWQDRGIWERTHLYFQLYQFFHIQGYKPTFYQEFFHALRENPTRRIKNVFVNASDDYLKFYKMACEVSGYDLTELFQAYGFFVVPQLTQYTLNNETKGAYQVGDYGTFYLVVNQEMIDSVVNEVKAMKLPMANIVFIEDRITAPDATYEGAPAGAKKTAFSGYPIGNGNGDVGQYTDFVSTAQAQGYKASYAEGNDGSLSVQIGHDGASGAVGFKVFDSKGKLVYLSNKYSFTVPKSIYDSLRGTSFTIVAAGANGTDQNTDAAEDYIEWIVKDGKGNVIKDYKETLFVGQTISDYPDALKAPFVSLPALTPFTYAREMEKKREVTVEITTPFKASTADDKYYYTVKVRNGYLIYGTTGLHLSSTVDNSIYMADFYRWAFYGNPYDGYCLKHKYTNAWFAPGEDYSNGAHPVMSNDSAAWTINYFDFNAANAPLFQLAVPGTTRYLNDYGGHGSSIAYYGNPSSIMVYDEEHIASPTQIRSTQTDESADNAYDMSGRRVDRSRKGIVISGGKKIIRR